MHYVSILLRFAPFSLVMGSVWLSPINPQTIDFNHYTSIASQDPLPHFLQVSSTTRAKAEMSPVTGSKKKQRVAMAEQEFLRHSTHEIDRLMASGRILYNDPIGHYCNQVLHKVLASEEVPDHLHVYVLKSPVVNAFATRQGYIIVSLGLLARLKTEAELAFILCHEYIHVKHQHAMQSVRKSAEDGQAKRRIPKDEAADLLRLESSRFSRALETEADLAGLNIFRKSSYAISASQDVFYMLKQAEKPVDSLQVKPEWLSLGQLQMPERLWVMPVAKDGSTKKANIDSSAASKSSSLEDDDERNYASHPDVALRLAAVKKSTDTLRFRGRQPFIIDENTFLQARKMAQYELCMLYLEDHRPELAFYHAKALETRYEKGYYLTLTQVRALYLLASAHAQRRFHKVHWSPEKAQGEERKLMTAFHNMQREELLLLALKHAWAAKQDYPKSPEFRRIADDLALQLLRHSKFTYQRFQSGTLPALAEHGGDTIAAGKPQSRKGASPKDLAYLHYGFQQEIKDTAFKNAFTRAERRNQAIEAQEKKKPSLFFNKRPPTTQPDHLLVVRPQGTQIDFKKRDQDPVELYEISENNTNWVHEHLEVLSPKFPNNISVLPSTLSEDFNAANLNQNFYAQQYMRQIRFNEGNKLYMWPLFQEEASKTFSTMGISHLAEMRLLRIRYPARGAIGRAVLLSVFLPYLTPIFIVGALKRPSYNIWFYQLYDLQQGKKVQTYIEESAGYLRKGAVKRKIKRSLKQKVPIEIPAIGR
jgi:Zn-dependent protease with chaperone function